MQMYREAIEKLTSHLVKKYGAEITYISTCQGVPEYWTDDSQLAKEIVGQIPEEWRKRITVDDSFHHPRDLIKLLGSYDLVIATRMHMAILALIAGTPVVPIAYEFKTRELFERLGQGQWVHDIDEINGRSLVESVDAFIDAIPKMREGLARRVNEERQSAHRAPAFVKEAYERWNARC